MCCNCRYINKDFTIGDHVACLKDNMRKFYSFLSLLSVMPMHGGYFSLTQKLCKLFILFLLRPNYLIMLSALNDKFDQLYVVLFGDLLILGSAYFTETEFFFLLKVL